MTPSVSAPRAGSAPAAAGIATDAPAAGPADPVKTLMRHHHALCADAVDPLEIAAGLEARGITDRVAAEYRHRDVFSLAEELHARVAGETAPGGDRPGVLPRPVWRGDGRCAVRPGGSGWGVTGTLAWLWLLGYGLAGDRVLLALLHHQGVGARALAAAAAPTALALACVVAPAAWCAHWFAARARAVLAESRSLAEFHARVRPVLLVALALFLGVLLAFLWSGRSALRTGGTFSAGPGYAAGAALGCLLFLARLLAAHGLARPAATATLAAAAAEAVPLGALLAARLPGCGALAWPVGAVADAHGPAALSLAACALPALALLAHAFPALTRASVHGRGDPAHAPTLVRRGHPTPSSESSEEQET